MLNKFFIVFVSIQLILIWAYLLANKKIHNIRFYTHEILEYKDYLSYSLGLTIILFGLICFAIYKKFIKPETSERFAFILEKLSPLRKFIEKLNIFYTAYDILFKKFGTGSPYVIFMIAMAKRIIDYSHKKNIVIIASFVILPRMIILLIFFTEMCFGQLHYYFYSLYLLLIPLVFRLILFLFKDLNTRVYPEAEDMVIHDANMKTINGKNCAIIITKLKSEYADIDPETFLPEVYYPLMYLGGHMEYITQLYLKIHLITIASYLYFHIMGFSYILYYNIYVL